MPHNTTLPSPASLTTARVWFVDNLRVLLISLVILHHVACIYSGLARSSAIG
jgi:glucan biosynthesis protein C